MYIVKNITSGALSFDLESGTFTLSPGRSIDLSDFCSNDWLLEDEEFRSLIDSPVPALLVVSDDISGRSPYYTSIVQNPDGTIDINAGTDINDDEVVTGDSSVQGNQTVSGNLSVSGNQTVSGNLSVSGNQTVSSNLSVSGNIDLSGSLTGASISKNDNGIISAVVTETTADLTLYVRSTGNDSNSGLTTGDALLTIQAALNKVPKQIKHAVVIDIGSGNFAGFYVTGFTVEHPNGRLDVQGTLGAFSPATGSSTGTATGGSTTQLVDAGQTWTNNDLIGKLVKIGNEYRFAYDNDGTSIDFYRAFSATCSGKAYEIVEPKTVLNSFPASNTYAYLEAYGNTATSDPIVNGIWISNFECDGQGNWYEAWWVWNSAGVSFERIYSYDNYWGAGWQNCWGRMYASNIWLEDGWTFAGFYATQSDSLVANGIMVKGGGGIGIHFDAMELVSVANSRTESCGSHGLSFYGGSHGFISNYTSVGDNIGINIVDLGGADCDGTITVSNSTSHGISVWRTKFFDLDAGTISDCGGYGLWIEGGTNTDVGAFAVANLTGNITIENNTSGGILVGNRSTVSLSNVDGINTGAYGVTVASGASALITSATGITGASGDATIDGGATTLTWATDFAVNGDIVVDFTTGNRITRRA